MVVVVGVVGVHAEEEQQEDGEDEDEEEVQEVQEVQEEDEDTFSLASVVMRWPASLSSRLAAWSGVALVAILKHFFLGNHNLFR